MKLVFFFLTCACALFGSEFDFDAPHGRLRLELERPIDTSTYLYVKFALKHFRERGASFVVLELNTPGGEVFAAKKIAELLYESDSLHNIPVLAYINDWALSAGALLVYNCRYVAISSSASMGAAEPVMAKGGAMESAPEKIRSALRAEFANAAALFGRDPLLAEAMVDQDMLLVRRGGQFFSLEAEEKIQPGDEVISPKGKLLTLNARQLEEFGFSQLQMPKLSSSKEISFSDWKVNFFAFLFHPAVISLLSLGIMLGLYLESSGVGHGLGAAFSALCLGLIFLSHSADGAIQWLEVLLIAVGVLLILLEMTLFSTAGLFYFLGALFLFGGFFALGLPDLGPVHFSFSMDQWNLAAFAVYESLGWFCAAFCAALLLGLASHRLRLSFLRCFVLSEPDSSSLALPALPALGSQGEAATAFRPFGKILIDGELFEASTEMGFIDKGENVKIIRIDGGRLIVRGVD